MRTVFVPPHGIAGARMRSLGANAPRFTPTEARAAAEATAALLSVAVRTAAGPGDVESPVGKAPVFLAVRRHIEAEIGSADLGVDQICRRFGISRSGLYRLFAPLGGVAEHIRRRRLARAYRELAGAGGGGHRVSEVAYRCGYANPAGFARAFRAEFGVSPADVRAGAWAESAAARPRSPSDLPVGDGWGAFYDWVLRLEA